MWICKSAAFGIAIYRLWIRTPFKSYEKGQTIYSVNTSAPTWRRHPKHNERWGMNWLWFNNSIHKCSLSTWHAPLPSHLDSNDFFSPWGLLAMPFKSPLHPSPHPYTGFLWTFLCLTFFLAPITIYHSTHFTYLSNLLLVFITEMQVPRRQMSLFTVVSALGRCLQIVAERMNYARFC